ncbi:MAG TPA: nidogen-like domain-containing protein [Bryobacteraceae bacterium]|jgi:hypothetical protein|nr:nidogen-like domain-containing protein [Bryobacteraceae bacterium]
MPSLCRQTEIAIIFCSLASALSASTITIPDSALTPTTSLYTNSLGSVVVMTGGGNANGAGDPSGRNDDGFSGPINLGFTLDFFGTDYTQFWINNNGNISFGGGISAYTPSGPTGATEPIISPFFGDVDTRNPASGVVMLNTSIPNEIIVTWPGVGYYDENADQLDTFQLVLRGPGYSIPAGQGQIGFFWTTMQWETGDASGGTGGFGGTPAAVGFGDGLGNGQVLQGSITNGISGIVNDEDLWFNLSQTGVPVTVSTTPEPFSVALVFAGLAGLLFFRRFSKKVLPLS